MNRYDMAMALHNTLHDFGKQTTTTQFKAASADITDWTTIGTTYSNYAVSVADCFAAGIITGMSDGAFHGEQTMTRAQACAVIVRMINRINGDETPAQPETPTQPTTPTQPEQPQQPETPAQPEPGKTLANGKEITVENVLEILAALEEAYPRGTTWCDPSENPDTNSYTTAMNAGITQTYGYSEIQSGDFKACMTQNNYSLLNLTYGCGGWACMVSNTIFGNTGFPARQVTDITKVRPGDIVITLKNGKPGHVSIVCKTGTYMDEPAFTTCDGNISGLGNQYNAVSWPTQYSTMTRTMSSNRLIFTRYPEGVAE